MDGWVEKLTTAEHKTHVVRLGEGLPIHKMGRALLSELADESTRVNPEEIDPHVWLDPVLAQEIVKRVTAALIEIAPAKRAGDRSATRCISRNSTSWIKNTRTPRRASNNTR